MKSWLSKKDLNFCAKETMDLTEVMKDLFVVSVVSVVSVVGMIRIESI